MSYEKFRITPRSSLSGNYNLINVNAFSQLGQDGNNEVSADPYSIAALFISDDSQSFESATYEDIEGVTNKSIALEAGKTYHVYINASIKTDSGTDSIYTLGLNLNDAENDDVIDIGTVRVDNSDGQSWESYTVGKEITLEEAATTFRPQIKLSAGSGVASGAPNREFGVYIYEKVNEYLFSFIGASTATNSGSDWFAPNGASAQTIDIADESEWMAIMAPKWYQSSGAPDVVARANLGSQNVEGYRSYDLTRNEHDHYIEKFTATANLTSAILQVGRSNGTGSFQLIQGMQQDLGLIPLDENTQYFEFVKSGNQDIATSTDYADLGGVSNLDCEMESGQKYVALISCSCSAVVSGGGDVRFSLTFGNGSEDTQTLDAGFIEVQASETRSLESALHIIPFTVDGNHTKLRLQAKRIAGSTTLRFLGFYNYQVIIRKVGNIAE